MCMCVHMSVCIMCVYSVEGGWLQGALGRAQDRWCQMHCPSASHASCVLLRAIGCTSAGLQPHPRLPPHACYPSSSLMPATPPVPSYLLPLQFPHTWLSPIHLNWIPPPPSPLFTPIPPWTLNCAHPPVAPAAPPSCVVAALPGVHPPGPPHGWTWQNPAPGSGPGPRSPRACIRQGGARVVQVVRKAVGMM